MDKTGLAKLVADLVEHVELASRVTEWLWNAHVLSLEAPDALEAKIGTFPVYLRAVDGSDIAHSLLFCHSLVDNNLTYYGNDMSGVAAISEALKGNTTLQSVKCILLFSPLLDQLAHKASAPIDVFA